MQPQPNAPVLRTRLVPRGHSRNPDSEDGASAQAPDEDNSRHPVAANSAPEAVPVRSIHESANMTAAVAAANSVDSQLSDHDQIVAVTREHQRTNNVSNGNLVSCI